MEEILSGYQENIHSVYITGSAVTDDFDGKKSDINSIFVLNEMDLGFLKLIAPLGKKHGRHKIAAPLIMTPSYIKNSLDVFPVEFLNFKLIHSTIYGEDLLRDLEVGMHDLRQQCEREIKSKLIWLRQGYLSSYGDSKALMEGMINSIAGYIPLFRGIILMLGKEPPLKQAGVITSLSKASGLDAGIFGKILSEKHQKAKHSAGEIKVMFDDCYNATEKLGRIVNDIRI